MEAPTALPGSSGGLSGGLLGFLDEHFKSQRDLARAPSLAAQLTRECRDLESDLLDLTSKLSAASAAWAARSDEVGRILRQLGPGPGEGPSRDGTVESDLPPRVRRILGVELPLLAKEVGRIETVRCYAETTLQLEVLVGDLEDAAFSIMSQASKHNLSTSLSKSRQTDTQWKQEKLLLAVKSMKNIERVLSSVARITPMWTHLLMAVDSRVENTLSVLRPQALTDHRALLASLGWPPPLSTANLEKDKCLEMPNPLVLMQGEKKEKYSRSFLAVCALQHLQAQREARQHDLLRYKKEYMISNSADVDKPACFNCGLWTIDELVHPIASRAEYHFSRWSDQPKFIFGLVYKITQDFLDGVDNVLQPLIDQARLVGYSAKEAWVSTMVKILSEYLTRRVFSGLVRSYDNIDGNMEVISSWLHLIDLMISFDKRMQALAASGTRHTGPLTDFGRFLPSLSVLSIFSEHPYWLQIWAEIELKDAMDKLKSELEDERSWSIDFRQQAEFSYQEGSESFLLSTRDDYKAPLIADSVVRISWAMIERGQALPFQPMRIQFIRSSVSTFLKHFISILLQCYQELEFPAAIIEDNLLQRVAASVNATQYCESVLREWSEDVGFLEMSIAEDDFKGRKEGDQHLCSSFFGDEIMLLVKLNSDYVVEIMSALLLQFEALSWEYIQNVEQWGIDQVSRDQILYEENPSVSPGFVEALDMLKDQIAFLKLNLNPKDFLELWRSIADGLDHFIFSSIPMSDVKFSCKGVHQFKADMRALLLIFRPFCVRPEAFFPFTNDSLKLLTMSVKDVDHLLKFLSKGNQKTPECLRVHELFHVSAGQAETILKNMKSGGLS